MNNKKILVTGAAGFIGYHLSKSLLDDGYTVMGVDNINAYLDTGINGISIGALTHQINSRDIKLEFK